MFLGFCNAILSIQIHTFDIADDSSEDLSSSMVDAQGNGGISKSPQSIGSSFLPASAADANAVKDFMLLFCEQLF